VYKTKLLFSGLKAISYSNSKQHLTEERAGISVLFWISCT